jgi:DNA-directed RNA polymerase sigma subunit (sigma70/sigma32)
LIAVAYAQKRGDILLIPHATSRRESMKTRSKIGTMAERLQMLSAEEKLVLRLRFALDGSYNHTLQDVANGLKTGPDQVREIEQGALLKLIGAAA